MVSSNSVVSFELVNLATTPPTIVGTFANVTSARASASSLTHWEIFYTVPKTNRPMTSGSPNLVYKKRIERHGDVRSDPTCNTDTPGSAQGQTKESGFFGV